MVANNIFPIPVPLDGRHGTLWQAFVKWLKRELDATDTRLDTAELESRARARVTRTTAQAVGNGVVSAVVWNATSYNTGVWSSTVNPSRLTALVAGTYHIEFCATWGLNAAGARYLAIGFNGGGIVQDTHISTTAAWYYASSMSTDVYMLAGDYVEGLCYQSSGAAVNIEPGAYPVSMSMYRLGA